MENVVKRIVIEKLFDLYDYDIEFKDSGITLITGPNGYGKTTILNIIKNALELNFWYFYELLFSSIKIYWGDNTILSFTKVLPQKRDFDDKQEMDSDSMNYETVIRHTSQNGKSIAVTTLNQHRLKFLRERVPQSLIRRGCILMEDSAPSYEYIRSYVDKELRKEFKELQLFSQQCNNKFIQAQRVFVPIDRHESVLEEKKYTITKLAESIKDMYKEQMCLYAEKSQKIDSTLTERHIKEEYITYATDEYQIKVSQLAQKISDFGRFGLVGKLNIVTDYKPELIAALSLHVDDMHEKFSVYDEFYSRLERFDKFVSGKGLSNKRMILDAKNGITFLNDNGGVIPLHKLSSGEQNLVILYYRLVFETNKETLLLMDEPEESIHAEWLEKMLDDYIEMQNLLGCQMIIATHSVTFINGHWDKAFDLFGGSYQDWMES